MDLNYESARFWITVANSVATVAVFIYIAVTRKSQVNEQRIEVFENRVSQSFEDVKTRVVKLEQQPNYLNDIVDIHKRINVISRDMGEMAGEFRQANEALKRIHDYMINKGRK